MGLLPLRAFLGITFGYAGLQKLSDPGFLHKGSGTYIGTQLHDFAHGTPGGFLLRAFPVVHPQLAGVAVASTEIAVGLLVLVGLATRLAAAVGLSLNLLLFLTASWHTHPYFLGSDIVFVFAWLPFVLVGARGQPALEHELFRATRVATAGSPSRRAPSAGETQITRRELMGRALALTGRRRCCSVASPRPSRAATAAARASTHWLHRAGRRLRLQPLRPGRVPRRHLARQGWPPRPVCPVARRLFTETRRTARPTS